ncbi:nucleotide sugar dehydrogenase [Georgenia halophila]|uniref:UDP-glucose 6-dehydrogenase n=1 Tax=Georgenia halophila TaxID=620889 RepID=A0ABP8LSJ6_9MICO
MRVAIVGLGHVGTVAAACLAESGHTVVGVDINTAKIDQLNAGVSPVVEVDLGDLVGCNVDRGRLSATEDLTAAVKGCDVAAVTVGTPSGSDGDVYLDDVVRVVGQIGWALGEADGWRLVVITSTVPPGTVEGDLVPLLEELSGKRAGIDFGVAFSPEFLRHGTAVSDFLSSPKTIVGTADGRAAQAATELYSPFATEVIRTSVPVAEMVKFSDTAWQALKVTFTNEIGRVAAAYGVDSRAVMSILSAETELSMPDNDRDPGFAFGGSRMPKDLRILTHRARKQGTSVPVLEAILESNRAHLDLALDKIAALGARRVTILGLAFTSGTDDVRESAALGLAARLLSEGYEVRIHDEHVDLQQLVGANRNHLLTVLPEIAQHLDDDLHRATEDADVLVVTQSSPTYARVTAQSRPDQTVLDLCGVARPVDEAPNYVGLTW